MKLNQLKKLIKESIEENVMEAYEPINEIGPFMVVMKPKRGMGPEEMLKEVSIYDSIIREEIYGAYLDKSTARKAAKEALKEYETQNEMLKKQMEEYRLAKKAIDEKRKEAKDTIMRLK